jgi:choline/glycine/proline betaine transport protein
MVLIAASDFGKIRIGGPDALPEFSTFSWYAMLISAGMGIGLMFWSVGQRKVNRTEEAHLSRPVRRRIE